MAIPLRPSLAPDRSRPLAWTAINSHFDLRVPKRRRAPEHRKPHACGYVARFIAGERLCQQDSCAKCSIGGTR